jgi:ABC-type nitrate/sulfonate/bicarbonate transport system permease component
MPDNVQVDTAPVGGGVPPRPKAGSKRRRGAARLLRSTSAIVAAIALWWFVTAVWLDSPRLYPTPLGVWDALLDIASGETPLGSTWMHLGATLERALLAFAIAYVIGTVLGVVAGRVPAFFDFMTPAVWIAFSVPSVVWVFLFLIVFGISNLVPIMALVVLLAAPVFLGAAEGTKAADKDLIAMADAYHVRGWRRLMSVYLPSIVPFLLANARVSFALAIRIVIIAEVVGLPDGVGLVVRYWADRLYMAPVVAWGLVLAMVGLIVDRYLIGYFERRTKRWSSAPTTES